MAAIRPPTLHPFFSRYLLFRSCVYRLWCRTDPDRPSCMTAAACAALNLAPAMPGGHTHTILCPLSVALCPTL